MRSRFLAVIGSPLYAGVLAAVVGVGVGSGAFTFWYGNGASYMTNDPAACANCHVMERQYSAWLQGSHRSAATCNDCHTPSPKLAKYVTKGQNGFWHSFAFTTGVFPEPIRIKPRNREVTERRCRECHEGVVDVVQGSGGQPVSCVRCHTNVGHRS